MQLTRDADCVELDRQDLLWRLNANGVRMLPEGVNYLRWQLAGTRAEGRHQSIFVRNQLRTNGVMASHPLLECARGWCDSSLRIGRKLAPLMGAAPPSGHRWAGAVSGRSVQNAGRGSALRPAARRLSPSSATSHPTTTLLIVSARLLGMTSRFVAASDMSDAVDRDTAVVRPTSTTAPPTSRTWRLRALPSMPKALTVWDCP